MKAWKPRTGFTVPLPDGDAVAGASLVKKPVAIQPVPANVLTGDQLWPSTTLAGPVIETSEP
jgi:hypothetical protein